MPSVEFFGHKVTAAETRLLSSRIEAIQSLPPPCIIRQLQAFLGLVNFYQHSLHRAAQILRPLVDVLCGGQKENKPVTWSASMQPAYATAKKVVADALYLARPLPGATLALLWTPRLRMMVLNSEPLATTPGNC